MQVVLCPCTSHRARLRVWRRQQATVQKSPPSSLVVRTVLVLALSASDTAVVPAPPAVLATSTVEIASDSATDVSLVLLPNAS
jgi:hypothetical protein